MIEKALRELLVYAEDHLDMSFRDAQYFERILQTFVRQKPTDDVFVLDYEKIAAADRPDELIQQFQAYFHNELEWDEERALSGAKTLIGLVTPPPSEVDLKFNALLKIDAGLASSYLYELGFHSYQLEKTAKEKAMKMNANIKPSYGLTLLFSELLGKEVDNKANFRSVSFDLNGAKKHLYFAPTCYCEHECYLEENVTGSFEQTLETLLCFCDTFDSYFLGVDNDGEIARFHGGKDELPLFSASLDKAIHMAKYSQSTLAILDFPGLPISVQGMNEDEVIAICKELNDYFARKENLNLLPLVRKTEDCYCVYLFTQSGTASPSLLNRCGLFPMSLQSEETLNQIDRLSAKKSTAKDVLSDNPELGEFETIIEKVVEGKASAVEEVIASKREELNRTSLFYFEEDQKTKLMSYLEGANL